MSNRRLADCGHGPHVARGLCNPCYKRFRKRGTTERLRVLYGKPPTCHPERKHRSSGLCAICYSKKRMLNWLYGMSLEDFESMLKAQGGLCAICRINKATDLDHDHSSGNAREILCNRCNTAIGRFMDDPSIMREAANYVEKHAAKKIAETICDKCGEAIPIGGWAFCKSRSNPDGHKPGTLAVGVRSNMSVHKWEHRGRE